MGHPHGVITWRQNSDEPVSQLRCLLCESHNSVIRLVIVEKDVTCNPSRERAARDVLVIVFDQDAVVSW